MTNLTSISLSLPIGLELNTAFLAYCAGIDPVVDWKLGGVSGYDDQSDEIDLSPINKFVSDIASGEAPEKNKLIAFAVQLFNEYWAGEPVIKRHFPNHQFIFVVGPPRTGGTYLLTQLYKATGIDHTSLNRWILRDTIPRTRHMARGRNDPKAVINGIFEIFQFLAWAKDSLPTNIVIQKNTRYANWIHVLDKIFESQATYAVTIRPPVPCMASFLQWSRNEKNWEKFLRDTPSDLNDFTLPTDLVELYDTAYYRHKNVGVLDILLATWEMNYCDIVQHSFSGNIIPFLYGDPMTNFFKSSFPDYLNESPYGLEWASESRDYGAFIEQFSVDQEIASATVARVKNYWVDRNLFFPDILAI